MHRSMTLLPSACLNNRLKLNIFYHKLLTKEHMSLCVCVETYCYSNLSWGLSTHASMHNIQVKRTKTLPVLFISYHGTNKADWRL